MRTTAITILTALFAVSAHPVSTSCRSTLFTTQQSRVEATWSVHNLSTLDYDGDGIVDMVGLIDPDGGGGHATLYSWHGVGDGTFQVPVNLGTAAISDLVAADVDNDGHTDLIMVASAAQQLLVRRGNGVGFDAPIVTTLNYAPNRLIAVSFDGDAFVDVITVATSFDLFAVYHGEGNGNFTEVRRVTTAHYPGRVAAADFDADGRVDVAYTKFPAQTIDVVFQNANGTFTAPVTLQSGQTPVTTLQDYASGLATADLDHDGRPDLVASNWQEEGPSASVVVFRSAASRTFTRTVLGPRITGFGGTFVSVRTTDIDGDGHADITTSSVNGGLVLAFMGKGDGTFYSPTYYLPENPGHVNSFAFGHFDGDGRLDLAAGTFGSFFSAKSSCATQLYLFSASPVVTQGDSAPLRAVVSGIGPDTPLPRGTVTFREGATVLGMADIDSTGYAALDVSNLSYGDHVISADFAGATSASSQSIIQKITSYRTVTTISFPPAQSVYGTPYTFNVTIRDTVTGTFPAWYTLDVDGVLSRRYTGTPITLNLTAGLHTITATFSGDSVTPASTSGPQSITTLKANPWMVASTGGALTVRLGQPHTLLFTVNGPNGVPGPTGTVQLNRGAAILTSGVLTVGQTTLSTTLERGVHDLVAVYSGDANFNAATLNLTLSVLPSVLVAIDARSVPNGISIRAVLPSDATNVQLTRSPSGMGTWTIVPGWTPASEFDVTVPAVGVLYDYRLTLITSGVLATSNIDPAMLFSDDPVVPGGTQIRRLHLDQLRFAVNAARMTASLPFYAFEPTTDGQTIQASHLATLRAALIEARQSMGLLPAVFTDEAAPGTVVKAVHVNELRRQVF